MNTLNVYTISHKNLMQQNVENNCRGEVWKLEWKTKRGASLFIGEIVAVRFELNRCESVWFTVKQIWNCFGVWFLNSFESVQTFGSICQEVLKFEFAFYLR